MLKKSIITLSFLIIFGFTVQAQDKCNRYSETSIGITFCAPTNWLIKKAEGEPYADIYGEARNGLAPNINVQAGPFKGTLSEATDSGISVVLKSKGNGVTEIEVKSRSEFAAANTKGFKVNYDSEVRGINIRSIQYFFSGKGDTKIVITATLLLSDVEKLESIIDESIKTLKISK